MSKRIYSVHSYRLSWLYLMGAAVENKEFAAHFQGGIRERNFMAATGELIRLINYVDDITTTIRRIHASLHSMEADERKRLADSLRAADAKLRELLAQVEK